MGTHDGSCNYQVFISYRKKDTGKTFTGSLHRALQREGIDAFLDRKNLPIGQQMLPNFYQNIRSSKMLIPVISKRYVDSEWCLKELAEMVDCYKPEGPKILPIFFNVKPTDVQNRTGIVKTSLKKYRKSHDKSTRKRWKKALTIVGAINGPKLEDVKGIQADLVDLAVKWALENSRSRLLEGAQHPVGLSTRVKKVEALLNFDSDDIEFVGICGTLGIGKTAIATAFYNRNLKKFRDSCFLAKIREETAASKGVEILQKKLIKDISKENGDSIPNSYTGAIRIQQRLNGLKVLLVLDDVDSLEQLNALAINHKWFGRGSKIIITSRKKYILNFIKGVEAKIYCPPKLSDNKSLRLFCLHAFSEYPPPEDYMKLCREAQRLATGLPSTLLELSSLLGVIKKKKEWRQVIQKLEGLSPTEIHQRLKSLYANLI
ncbi:hypothetical protein NE237_016311 [Protea cynaroides]|uniref:TIR domain-containing protein n=1 Tax=Protea cynaroides TaxID=273540 RepID=A0A9Q0GL93_9MAGN|nr:hypothetical protein NE237_016311 [Protea cynaroides]